MRALTATVLTLIDLFKLLTGNISFVDFLKGAGKRVLNVATGGVTGGGDLVSAIGLQELRPDQAVSPGDISNINGDRNINIREIPITVQGGQTNEETGAAVSDGVFDGLNRFLLEADLETAPGVAG